MTVCVADPFFPERATYRPGHSLSFGHDVSRNSGACEEIPYRLLRADITHKNSLRYAKAGNFTL
jgi:hypothetical protein